MDYESICFVIDRAWDAFESEFRQVGLTDEDIDDIRHHLDMKDIYSGVRSAIINADVFPEENGE